MACSLQTTHHTPTLFMHVCQGLMRLADTVGGDASLYILRTNSKYKLASKKELNRFNQVDSPYNVNGELCSCTMLQP